MSGPGHRTPRKVWWKPMPNPQSPAAGGALLNILPYGDDAEVYTVGLDLHRLLALQRSLAALIQIVVAQSLPQQAEVENPITETEIERFIRELDQPTEEGTTNE